MSNVIAFEKAQDRPAAAQIARAPKSMTLFIHIKRTTLIAHCGNLAIADAAAQGRVGKSL